MYWLWKYRCDEDTFGFRKCLVKWEWGLKRERRKQKNKNEQRNGKIEKEKKISYSTKQKKVVIESPSHTTIHLVNSLIPLNPYCPLLNKWIYCRWLCICRCAVCSCVLLAPCVVSRSFLLSFSSSPSPPTTNIYEKSSLRRCIFVQVCLCIQHVWIRLYFWSTTWLFVICSLFLFFYPSMCCDCSKHVVYVG